MRHFGTGTVSALIGHPFANYTLDGLCSTLGIGNFKGCTLIVSEIKFRQVPLQMLLVLLAHMVLGACDPTL